MKKILIILICSLGIAGYAVAQQQLATQAVAPTVNMRSVNNSSMMSSGSLYSSTIQEVGAYSPAGVRKAPPSADPTKPTSDEFNNPQYGPVGDALIPLLLMGMAYAAYVFLRRRKSRA